VAEAILLHVAVSLRAKPRGEWREYLERIAAKEGYAARLQVGGEHGALSRIALRLGV